MIKLKQCHCSSVAAAMIPGDGFHQTNAWTSLSVIRSSTIKSKHLKGRLDPPVSDEKCVLRKMITFSSERKKTLGSVQMFLPEMHLGPTILGPPPVGRHRT